MRLGKVKTTKELRAMETMNFKITNKSYFEMEHGFFKVPNFIYELAEDMGLNRVERDIYMCLIRYANGSNRNPFPSYKILKKYTMVKKNDTIAKAIRRLEELGLIAVISKGTTQGQSNVYKVNYVYPVKAEKTEKVEEVEESNDIDVLKSMCSEPVEITEAQDTPKKKQKGLYTSKKKEAEELTKHFEDVDVISMLEAEASVLDNI
ncbi:helix-turn-helix domain-containing protein [Clostridium culturomicium]|uniref:helix-turn-helix domain-containing protein n=1 Tax=Clostridium culturomicium TaxID=1499683 RepID=UPI0038574A1F